MIMAAPRPSSWAQWEHFFFPDTLSSLCWSSAVKEETVEPGDREVFIREGFGGEAPPSTASLGEVSSLLLLPAGHDKLSNDQVFAVSY